MTEHRSTRPSLVEGLEIGLEDAALLIGKSHQHVRNLVKAGLLRQTKPGTYLATDVAQAALRSAEDLRKTTSRAALSLRLQEAKARKIELENAQADGELISVVEATDFDDELMGAFKAGLGTLPFALCDRNDLAGRARVEGECDALLTRLAAMLAKRASELDGDGAGAGDDDG